jgi:hypothetical protein
VSDKKRIVDSPWFIAGGQMNEHRRQKTEARGWEAWKLGGWKAGKLNLEFLSIPLYPSLSALDLYPLAFADT